MKKPLALLGLFALLMTSACENPFYRWAEEDAAPSGTARTYTVTFDKNGGDTEANPQTITVSSPATTVGTLPDAPARANYTFTEWNTQSDGNGTPFTASTPVTADITVYAKWTAVPPPGYTVTLSDIGAEDQGEGIFTGNSFEIFKNSAPNAKNITVNGTWDTIEWLADGVERGTGSGSGFTFTVNAADYTLGGHSLNIIVMKNGVPWSKSLTFEVRLAVTGVSLNKTSLILPEGGSETLTASVLPGNAANKEVNWSTSDVNIATVNNGLVSGVSTGTAVITATTVDRGYQASCTVQVGQKQNISLAFSDTGTGIFSAATFTITRNGTPDTQSITVDGTWDAIEWLADGIVKGTGAGNNFNFTVNAADYTAGGHSLTVTVTSGGVLWSKTLAFTVRAGVTGVNLNKANLTLPVGGSETLTASVLPANAFNKSLSWSTNNVNVATVSSSGLVSAKIPGTAVITATTQDGGWQASCTVQVMPAASLSLQFTDTGQGIFSQGTFTVRKTGTPQSQSITVDGTWDAIEWLVDGVKRGTGTGSGFTFTVNAADYTAGGHSLSVSVIQGGVPWSKSLNFTVTN